MPRCLNENLYYFTNDEVRANILLAETILFWCEENIGKKHIDFDYWWNDYYDDIQNSFGLYVRIYDDDQSTLFKLRWA